jgi:hypothetical protein
MAPTSDRRDTLMSSLFAFEAIRALPVLHAPWRLRARLRRGFFTPLWHGPPSMKRQRADAPLSYAHGYGKGARRPNRIAIGPSTRRRPYVREPVLAVAPKQQGYSRARCHPRAKTAPSIQVREDGQTVIAPPLLRRMSCAVNCTNTLSCVGHFWDTSYSKTRRLRRIGEHWRAAKSLILLLSVAAVFAGVREVNNF